MTGDPAGIGDVHADVSGGRQEVVVTARDITGLTITTAGLRVPGYLQDPQRWTLVEDWDALTAGAHRARPDEAGSAVPPYVARDADAMLQARLTLAAQRGGLVLMVGESTAGKTRAAHQAVRRCEALAGYRVLAPDTGPDLVIAVEVVASTSVQCLVWLDDLERFLAPGGLEAGVLAELVRLRTPVLATMQLRHYDTFYPRTAETRPQDSAGPQSSGTGARVLKQTEPLHLPRRWSPDELTRAQDCDDPRIIDAVTHRGSYGVAEYLAAGPALLSEWRYAARPGGHPRGAALVSAAVDLARTGLRPPYSTSVLASFHQHYLCEGPLLRPEPTDEALAWAGSLRYGATSLLLPTSDPDTWDVFDYLPDHTTSPVAERAWQAALDHAADDDERFTIGLHAYGTAPHVAAAAWRPLAQHVPVASYSLGVLLAEAGHSQEAADLYRQAAEAGHTDAMVNLGNLLAEAGHSQEAEEWYRQAMDDSGSTNAPFNLGVLLARTGHSQEAADLFRQAAEAGRTDAAFNLGNLLAEAGHSQEAEEWYRQAAEAGHADAAYNLGNLLVRVGHSKKAERAFRQAMAAGHADAAFNLGNLLFRIGRSKKAVKAYRRAMAAGHTDAPVNLGNLLAEAGHSQEAERAYRQAVAAGHTDAPVNLGVLLVRIGRSQEAEVLFRQATEAGHTNAAVLFGALLVEAGRRQEAERVYRLAAEAGNADAAFALGVLLVRMGRSQEAEVLFRQAAEAGHTNAAVNRGVLLALAGRRQEAEVMFRQAAEAGNAQGAVNLGALLAEEGRSQEAADLYRQAAEAGHTEVAVILGALLAEERRSQKGEDL